MVLTFHQAYWLVNGAWCDSGQITLLSGFGIEDGRVLEESGKSRLKSAGVCPLFFLKILELQKLS
jgi:hypothetical protein